MGKRWVILGVIFVARIVIGYQFQSIASIAPYLLKDLQVNYAQVGVLIGLYDLPGLVFAFSSGYFSRRFGDKVTCAIGLTLMALGGLLLGWAGSFTEAVAGRLISGAGSIVFELAMTKMVTDWFAGREIVLAMGIFLASWPLGVAVGLLCQGLQAESFGWRSVMDAPAILCCLSVLIIWAGYRTPTPNAEVSWMSQAEPEVRKSLPPKRQLLAVVVAGVIWANLNLACVLYFSFAPALLVEHGVSLVTAGALTGSAAWIAMFSVPLGGYLVQRSGRTDASITLFCFLSGLVLLALPSGLVPILFCTALGIVAGVPAGPMMALPSRILGPEHRALGLGVFYTAFYIVFTSGPALGGVARDAFGTAAPIMLAAAFFMAILPMQLLLRRLEVPEPAVATT